jgi:hypothetical protein
MGAPAPSILMQDRFGKNERNFDVWRATVDTFRTFLGGAAGNLERLEQTQQSLNQRV